MTSDGSRTFEWDAANRFTAINIGTHRSEFTYDGVGHRVEFLEKEDGNPVAERHFVWESSSPTEERDSSGAVVQRILANGFQLNGTSLLASIDHLESVREVSDSSGLLRARYNFDPWGRRTKLTGDVESNLGFTGYFLHESSGLQLAWYRAYVSDLGQWLSGDPLRSLLPRSLYSYGSSNPIRNVDPLGLAYFAKRPLEGVAWNYVKSCNPLDDYLNTEWSHEQLFFEDGKLPANLGFFGDGI